MSGETTITVIGNLTRDPELAFTQQGTAYARFTIASTPRRYEPNTNEWTDGEALFLRCTTWRQMAENTAESLSKGARVIVTGRLKLNTWQNEAGENRSSIDVDVDEVGPSLRFHTARPARMERTSGNGSGTGRTSRPRSADVPDEPPF